MGLKGRTRQDLGVGRFETSCPCGSAELNFMSIPAAKMESDIKRDFWQEPSPNDFQNGRLSGTYLTNKPQDWTMSKIGKL
jgi:hypothetical protein